MITKQEIQPVITKKVVITDSLFASYVNAIAEHLLPYQWKVLNDQIPGAEKSHCIDNFRIAAGEMEEPTRARCSRIRTYINGWKQSPSVLPTAPEGNT